MIPLFLLLFMPAAIIGSGLLAYNLLQSNQIEDINSDMCEVDYVVQMYEYYTEEKE